MFTKERMIAMKGKNRSWEEYTMHLMTDLQECKSEIKKLNDQLIFYRESHDIKYLAVDRVSFDVPELKYSFLKKVILFLIEKFKL